MADPVRLFTVDGHDAMDDAADAAKVILVDSGGSNVAPSSQDVAEGKISNRSTINKYGQNTEIDSGVTADIWSGGKTVGALPAGTSLIWVAPTTACIHNIKSSSGDDASGGVGARTIRVYFLPDWNTAEKTEDKAMDGTNDVPMTNSSVIIHRMKVLTKGATGVNVGTITATATSPSDTTVTARIEVGTGQTLMAVYGIPSTQTLYMKQYRASIKKGVTAAASVDILLLVNPEPDAELLNFICKDTLGLLTQGTSVFPQTFDPVKIFEGPAIIKIQAVSSANDMSISAGFNATIVNN